MDRYAFYKYEFVTPDAVQTDWTLSEGGVAPDRSLTDKQRIVDRLFGQKNTQVRIQRTTRNGADKFPCTVMGHQGQICMLRLENEKMVKLYVKSKGNGQEIPSIEIQPFAHYPYSYVIIDCRVGKNMIAIKIDSDAWRNTDTVARLLEESLNLMLENIAPDFRMKITPETLPRDFVNYSRYLIKKKKLKVKKMTIYFTGGKIDSKMEEIINQTPYLKRLRMEMFEAPQAEFTYHNPFGPRIIDKRKKIFDHIVELVSSNIKNEAFGLRMTYEDDTVLSCGESVRAEFTMSYDTFSLLFVENLFHEVNIAQWLDEKAERIQQMKDGTLDEWNTATKRKNRI